MSEVAISKSELNEVFSPKRIREQSREIFSLTSQGKTNFKYNPEKFESTVNFVMEVIKENYPSLNIPFHSRWGHFRAGGIDRIKPLDQKLSGVDSLEKARSKLDLVIASVLLDAGAGMSWRYFEKESQKTFSRSEGLGLASLQLFLSGQLSEDGKSLRANAEGLSRVTTKTIEDFFQVSDSNPLVGVDGRKTLLTNLSKALANKEFFKDSRPGNLIDYLKNKCGQKIPATEILNSVLWGLGDIWPGRLSAHGKNLGDVWNYLSLKKSSGATSDFNTLVPFHKLSQWMTYSLIEPIIEAGFEVTGVNQLTGLSEYRNGGLMIDSGLIQLKDGDLKDKTWTPDSELIIEWRALTVYLLDQIGSAVCKNLGRTPEEFPLAKVLEGGTWWAGRKLAQNLRADGGSPIKIASDGTVF